MSPVIKPGLIILHGNQLEELQSAVFTWISQYPLHPLEKDIFLVQSNGVAEWLKISLADNLGICAANRIELPGRFLWTVYRSMLGRSQIPSSSFLDKSPLTWRLMRLLPELLDDPVFLQLAARLADLIDLYRCIVRIGYWIGVRVKILLAAQVVTHLTYQMISCGRQNYGVLFCRIFLNKKDSLVGSTFINGSLMR